MSAQGVRGAGGGAGAPTAGPGGDRDSSESPSSLAPSIDAFNDPVLCDIMRDPVITEDGHSYERTSIETWFARGHRTSPCTGAQLSSTTLIPNHNLRIAIEEFLELHQQGRLPARSRQEEERALKLAIRVLEKRLRDVNTASRPRVGGGSFGGSLRTTTTPPPPTGEWLQARMDGITQADLDRYLALFLAEGATNMRLLAEAEYTREDLITLGVNRPHAATILRAVNEYVDDFLALPAPTITQEAPGPAPVAQAPAPPPPPPPVVPTGANSSIEARARIREALDSGNYAGVVTGMREFMHDDDFVGDALFSICAFLESAGAQGSVHSEAVREQIGAAGACELIVTILHMWQHDEDMWGEVLRVVSALAAQHAANQSRLGEAGAIEEIAVIMARPYDDSGEDYFTFCCSAVSALVTGHSENQGRIGATGICDSLVSALQEAILSRDRRTTFVIFDTGAAIAVNSADNCERLGQLGLPDSLMAAIGTWPTPTDGEQIKAVKLIASLCAFGGNKETLGAAGACNVVLEGIQSTSSDAVQLPACKAIRALAHKCPSNQARFGDAGACELLATGLARLDTRRGLRVEKCGAIADLAADHAANKDRFYQAHACEQVVAIMRVFGDYQGAVRVGCKAIKSLATWHEGNRDAIGAAGGCEQLLLGMEASPTDMKLQLDGCMAISALAEGHAGNKERLGARGACEHVLMLSTTVQLNLAWSKNLCAAIRRLGEDSRDNTERLVNGGAGERIVSILRAHLTDADVCEDGCGTLVVLAARNGSEAQRRAVGQAGACEQVVLAMRAHPAHHGVYLSGVAAIVAHVTLKRWQRRQVHIHVTKPGLPGRKGRGRLQCYSRVCLYEFEEREALVEACVASTHIPFFMDGKPLKRLRRQTKAKGLLVLDGSFLQSNHELLDLETARQGRPFKLHTHAPPPPLEPQGEEGWAVTTGEGRVQVLLDHSRDEALKRQGGLDFVTLTSPCGIKQLMRLGYT